MNFESRSRLLKRMGENSCKQIIEGLFKLLLKLIIRAGKNVSELFLAMYKSRIPLN